MKKSIVKNTIFKIVLTLVNVAVPLLAGPYLARVLDVDLYATYNQAIAVVAWFTPFATFGIYNYAMREISKNRDNKFAVSTLFSRFFCIGAIATIITSAVYLIVISALFKGSELSIYTVLVIEVMAQMFYIEWMNEAYENYSFIMWKTLVVKLLYLVCVFTLIKRANDVVVFTLIASSIVLLNYASSFVYVKLRTKFVRFKLFELKPLIAPLLIMLLLTNANLLYTYLDRLFLTIFAKNDIESTYYQFAFSIVFVVSQIVNSIIVVSIPRLSKYLGNGETGEYRKLLLNTTHYYLMFGIPLCIGMAVFSYEGMLLYGGEKYIAASSVLRLFSLRTILCLIERMFSSQILFINGQEKKITLFYFISGFLNLVLNSFLVLISALTPENLIITTMISETLLITLEFKEIRKIDYFHKHIFDRYTVTYCVAPFGFVPIHIVMSKLLKIGETLSLRFAICTAITVCICIIYYSSVLLITRDVYLCDFIRKLARKRKPQ